MCVCLSNSYKKPIRSSSKIVPLLQIAGGYFFYSFFTNAILLQIVACLRPVNRFISAARFVHNSQYNPRHFYSEVITKIVVRVYSGYKNIS